MKACQPISLPAWAAAIAAGRADLRVGTATRTSLPGAAFDHQVSKGMMPAPR